MRVIAGALGGRRLKPVPGSSTRPTADRVKEALFSVLGPLDGARVLDLYAGTGSLGIEALSRGAAHAVFVENARPALAVLRSNVETLGLADRSSVVASDVARSAASLAKHGPFDLVFVDPPWADLAIAVAAVEAIAKVAGSPEAVVVVEHASRDVVVSTELVEFDRRRYGDTGLTLFRPKSAPGD